MIITQLPDKKDWAEQIDMLRRVNRITVKKLAVHMGISHPTIAKILKGNNTYEMLSSAEKALKELVDKKRREK